MSISGNFKRSKNKSGAQSKKQKAPLLFANNLSDCYGDIK